MKNKIFYILVITFSAIFIWLGNFLVSQNYMRQQTSNNVIRGTITNIIQRTEDIHEVGNSTFINLFIIFEAITSDNEIVTAEFSAFGQEQNIQREIQIGDRVILMYNNFTNQFLFIEFERINYILILGVFIILLFIILGRAKGAYSILALIITCLAIFLVLIPSIINGFNIYVTSIIVTIFSIATTLAIVAGPTKKAITTFIGCMSGIFIASLLMYSMDILLKLTGLIDSETRSLVYFVAEHPINVRAVIFAGVIIGASGAITDVAMSISSALWEVQKASSKEKKELFKSGIEIGKDILGTMLNTLVLAYIGTSLSLILLIQSHTTTFLELFNTEMIIVEFLRSAVGTFGMIVTVPVTTTICCVLYTKRELK